MSRDPGDFRDLFRRPLSRILLIGIALDAIMHGRKVLHISTKETVEHVRHYYDQILESYAAQLGLDAEMPHREGAAVAGAGYTMTGSVISRSRLVGSSAISCG